MRALEIQRGNNFGENTGVIPLSSHIDRYGLVEDVAKTITVPTGARVAVFSTLIDFYVKEGTTAVIPTTDVTNGSAPMLNAYVISVVGIEQMTLIAPTSGEVLVAYYE